MPALVATFASLLADAAAAQPGRLWQPGDRSLITSFVDVAALALGRREVYVAGESGIAVWDHVEEAWRPPLAPLEGYPERQPVASLAYDGAADALWLGTEDGQLLRLGLTVGQWEPAEFRIDEPIIRIVPDAMEGLLWIGTSSGWYRVRGDGSEGSFVDRASQIPSHVREIGETDLTVQAMSGTLTLDDMLQRFPIETVIEGERPGTYFVGTQGGGLLLLDGNTLERTWLPFGTLSRGAGTVALVGNRLWFGGDGQGPRNGFAIADRNLRRWTQIETEVGGGPRGFTARIVPAGNAVWFAASDGAYRLDNLSADSAAGGTAWTRFTTAQGLPADQTTTVVPLVQGAWIGTLRGLARVDGAGRVSATALEGRRILDLVLTGDTLWIATESGLFASIGDGAPAPAPGVDAVPALRTTPIVSLAARTGSIVALTPAAVHRFEGGRWTAASQEGALAGLGRLLRLHVDTDGTIWVGGEGGAASLGQGAVRTWLVPDDIPAGPVRGLLVDGDNLWVATPAGALRLNPTR